MKTCSTIIALMLVLGTAFMAKAQTEISIVSVDTVYLSKATDGKYLISKYGVRQQGNARFSLHYPINSDQLQATFDDNAATLTALNTWMNDLKEDASICIFAVTITGYASPDGSQQLNQKLAANRALDMQNPVDQGDECFGRLPSQMVAVATDWCAIRPAVVQSTMPDKQAVLKIIDNVQLKNKERALKRLPEAWHFIKKNLLPPLRRVELVMDFETEKIIKKRTSIPQPAVKPPCPPCPCPRVIIEEQIDGIMIEMEGNDVG
ncbi:MAG: hypothetical protein RR037_06455 [Alistipes sp.]